MIEPSQVQGTVRTDSAAVGLWQHAALLPATTHRVSLGEGGTPLLPLDLASGAGGLEVHAKLESLNPTLSFKDRAMALGASVALDLGMTGLMLASSGNAATSAAAYATAAGLECRLFCGTASHADAKLAGAAAHGAEVHVVSGDYSTAYEHAVRAEADGWFNVTTTYRNPVLAEAYRGIAVELYEQLGVVPDVVVVPVGAGPLARGILGGFADLRANGRTRELPRLLAVQARSCAPLARAWGMPGWRDALTVRCESAPTQAGAIADSLRGYEREGLLTLEAVRDSGGAVVAVDEESLAKATRTLAQRGLLVEPAAAAALAALDEPEAASMLKAGARVVLMLTGHGAKHGTASLPTTTGAAR